MFKILIREKKLLFLLKIYTLIKACSFLIILLSYYNLPFCQVCYKSNFVYPPHESVSFWTTLKTWDAQHYLYLSEKGYADNLSRESVRFYPLFPYLIKILNFIFSSSLLSGLILSNFFSFLAVVYLYFLIKKFYHSEMAFRSLLFLMAFPTAFYLNLVYTESLFLFLAAGFLYFLFERKFLPSLVIGFFLPLSRPQGILVGLPLFVYFFDKKLNFLRTKNFWLLVLSLLGGLLSYFLFMKEVTGSFFGGLNAQKYNVSQFSLTNIFHPFDWFLNNFVFLKFNLHGFTTSLIDRSLFFAFLFLLVLGYGKLNKTLWVYMLITGLIPALADHFMSYSRYLLVVFPLFMVLAILIKRKDDLKFILFILFLWQMIFLVMHSLNFWVA